MNEYVKRDTSHYLELHRSWLFDLYEIIPESEVVFDDISEWTSTFLHFPYTEDEWNLEKRLYDSILRSQSFKIRAIDDVKGISSGFLEYHLPEIPDTYLDALLEVFKFPSAMNDFLYNKYLGKSDDIIYTITNKQELSLAQIDKILSALGDEFTISDNFFWNNRLSEELISKYWYSCFSKYSVREIIIQSQRLGIDFIETYIVPLDSIDMYRLLSVYQDLSESFIVSHLDKFLGSLVSEHQVLSDQFIFDNFDFSGSDSSKFFSTKSEITNILTYQKLSVPLLDRIMDSDIMFMNNMFWYYISTYQALSVDLIFKYRDYLDWIQLISNEYISKDVLLEFIEFIRSKGLEYRLYKKYGKTEKFNI